MFPGTGHWRIEVRTERSHTLVRECLLQANGRYRLDVPPASCAVHGTTSDFKSYAMFHGTAGPRLLLRNEGDGFDFVQHLPDWDDSRPGPFRLADLPAGSYSLHHHLSSGGSHRDDRGVAGWGGRVIELSAMDDLDLGDLAEPRPGELVISVLTATGEPLDAATLSVIDPLWHAWSEFSGQPTTATFADAPIPRPPSARLRGDPVTLRDIRQGRLYLRVETDAGNVIDFATDVDPAQPLTITLP